MDIYVGNLAYTITKEDLENLFGKFGEVTKVRLVEESYSGQAKGWGFVTMEKDEDALRAIEALNLKLLKGKKLKVNKYRPKSKKGPKFGEWISY
jgi:RNA recognition motif-containing protein